MHLYDIPQAKKGQHLKLAERIEIQTLHRQGYSNRSIARLIKRSHATINNEIKRGIARQVKIVSGKYVYKDYYFAQTGQAIYMKNRSACGRKFKLIKAQAFISYAEKKILKEKWSPDVIVGHARQNKLYPIDEMVCTGSLYNYIDSGLLKVKNIDLLLKVRRKTKKERTRQNKRNLGKSIEERPEVIGERTEFGHWEIDTVLGKKSKTEPVLLTLTERVTRYQMIIKIGSKNEEDVNKAITSLFDQTENAKQLFKSFTADNGSEFSGLSNVVDKLSDVYFAHPYSSWERGTNENHNGIIRRFLPKGKAISLIYDDTIDRMSNWMNNLPRKILNYQTPTDLFIRYVEKTQLA